MYKAINGSLETGQYVEGVTGAYKPLHPGWSNIRLKEKSSARGFIGMHFGLSRPVQLEVFENRVQSRIHQTNHAKGLGLQMGNIYYSVAYPVIGVQCMWGAWQYISSARGSRHEQIATLAKGFQEGSLITDTTKPDVLNRPKRCCGIFICPT